MQHWIMAPLLLPLIAGMVNLLLTGRGIGIRRGVSLASTAGVLAVSLGLLAYAGTGGILVYRLGDWAAPFGIVLVLDRLSALLLVTCAVLALMALLHALGGDDRRGHNFHVFFPIQLLGINGAFLTGDLFNLFVFFEILLIASYCLALHGGGPERVRASLHYVVLNLIGSALFLLAVGTLYGLTGTLNMADLAVKVAASGPEQAALLGAAGLLLLVVFGLKAALLPLSLWLPALYGSAAASVAALFAILTKVGVYSIVRMVTLIFTDQGPAAEMVRTVLPVLGLMTLAAGSIGVLGSQRLRHLVAWLVVMSAGTLLTGIGQGNSKGMVAAFYYLPHTTWVTAGLFLLTDLIARQRGEQEDAVTKGPPLAQPALLGLLFFLGSVAAAGLPPLSGFVGKVLLLQSAAPGHAPWLWGMILLSGLLSLIAFSRAGSRFFWATEGESADGGKANWLRVVPTALLLALSVAMTVGAAPISRYAELTAQQLLQPALYRDAVLIAKEEP